MKKMTKTILLSVFLMIFMSCDNNINSTKDMKDIIKYSQDWLNFYKEKDNNLSINNFKQIEENSKEKYGINTSTFFTSNFLDYSENREKAIDLFSYFDIKKVDNEYIIERDVDSNVVFHDMINKKSFVINFSGPSGSFDDVKWINNNEFLLFSTFDVEGDGNLTLFITHYKIDSLKNDLLVLDKSTYEQKTNVNLSDISENTYISNKITNMQKEI